MSQTPEPWITVESASQVGIYPSQHRTMNIARLGRKGVDERDRENAVRIVACVNACEGLNEDEIKEAVREWKQKHHKG